VAALLLDHERIGTAIERLGDEAGAHRMAGEGRFIQAGRVDRPFHDPGDGSVGQRAGADAAVSIDFAEDEGACRTPAVDCQNARE